MAKKETLTYEAAMERLETIVQGFEQNTLELDQLTAQLAEAQELIKYCSTKLQQVETDVKKILNNEQNKLMRNLPIWNVILTYSKRPMWLLTMSLLQ